MAAARRGAWGGGQSAGSLTGGRQLDPRHRQGARGHTREEDGERAEPSEDMPHAAESLMPAPMGRQPETQPIRGTQTSGRCDASDTGGRALPPPSPQCSHPPLMPSASGRWGHGKPNAHAPAKPGPQGGEVPTQKPSPEPPSRGCVRGWDWAVLPLGPPPLRQPPLRLRPPLRQRPRPPPTLRNWHSRTTNTNATKPSRNASKMAADGEAQEDQGPRRGRGSHGDLGASGDCQLLPLGPHTCPYSPNSHTSSLSPAFKNRKGRQGKKGAGPSPGEALGRHG